MSCRNRKKIRKNTTVISVMMFVVAGILLGLYALFLGDMLFFALPMVISFFIIAFLVGKLTWWYETYRLNL